MSRARDFADLAGSADAGGLTGKNMVVNGAMQVAQRGTSFTNKASGSVYRLDRWEVSSFNVGDGLHNISQSTTAPDGFTFSTKIECATQDTSQDANNQFYYQQQIEAQDINHLKFYESNPDSVTLSFHVRSNRTGTFPVALKISDNNSADDNTATRIYQVTYSVSSADTWEKKTVTFPLDSSSQTKPTGNNFGMAVQFWLGAGTNRDGATANVWADNGNATIAADNLDILGSTSNDWYITGVQLELGEQATPFEHRSYGDELHRCKRFFVRHSGNIVFAVGQAYSTSQMIATVPLQVEMRASPTLAHQNIRIRNASGSSASASSLTISNQTKNFVELLGVRDGSGLTAGNAAQIRVDTTGDHIDFIAEL